MTLAELYRVCTSDPFMDYYFSQMRAKDPVEFDKKVDKALKKCLQKAKQRKKLKEEES